MARTPLFTSLIRVLKDTLPPQSVQRRTFIKSTGAAAALSMLSSCALGRRLTSHPRIGILGGGLAGCAAAYALNLRGVPATILEGSSRIGGRVFSAKDLFPDNQVIELGGEILDSNHVAMQSLVSSLGLTLTDLHNSESAVIRHDTFDVDGDLLSYETIKEEFTPLVKRILSALDNSEQDQRYFDRLDGMSIDEWLELSHATKRITSLLKAAYTDEYGVSSSKQSSFNLLNLISPAEDGSFRIYGDSDERFHIEGGNEEVIKALLKKLSDTEIQTEALVESIAGTEKGPYTVSVRRDGISKEFQFDIIIVTLPFTLLRKVSLDIPLTPIKREVISKLGYGTNAKIMAGFKERVWATAHNCSASTISTSAMHTVWETSRGQQGKSGILTNFLGGDRGARSHIRSPQKEFEESLKHFNRIFPGSAAAYDPDHVTRMHWPTHKFTEGSYACYLIGQGKYLGQERIQQGNVYFAGEHCSEDFQGFMEGAAETGLKAAQDILSQHYDITTPL